MKARFVLVCGSCQRILIKVIKRSGQYYMWEAKAKWYVNKNCHLIQEWLGMLNILD